MAEELFESDVVFSDQVESEEENETLKKQQPEEEEEEEENSGDEIDQAEKKKTVVSSKPMRIPEETFRRWGNDDYEFGDEEEMVPPHVIMARRLAGKMKFSMCFGNGRTLKGRDLSRVRNSILRMTGFIEV
ncbi:uncharacterized protein LOC127080128 [Lathyrus oleraceus]|uniref:Senescence regulator n=1 Tax=Pisum sativum TaxID=3888 RepID=A0A9D5BQ15_PEA|nr:uncharacterized protein LOC127080128 [Pisum sativum]KAI5447595.1 hypothetical protein KIW84_015160 [Pisum sativum]